MFSCAEGILFYYDNKKQKKGPVFVSPANVLSVNEYDRGNVYRLTLTLTLTLLLLLFTRDAKKLLSYIFPSNSTRVLLFTVYIFTFVIWFWLVEKRVHSVNSIID